MASYKCAPWSCMHLYSSAFQCKLMNIHKYRYEEDTDFACLPQTADSAANTLQDITLWLFHLWPQFFSLLFLSVCPSVSHTGGAGRLVHKWTGSDAVHQHWWRLLLSATVHGLHPWHNHLPPQRRRQAPRLLQRGQGGCQSTAETSQWIVDSVAEKE